MLIRVTTEVTEYTEFFVFKNFFSVLSENSVVYTIKKGRAAMALPEYDI